MQEKENGSTSLATLSPMPPPHVIAIWQNRNFYRIHDILNSFNFLPPFLMKALVLQVIFFAIVSVGWNFVAKDEPFLKIGNMIIALVFLVVVILPLLS